VINQQGTLTPRHTGRPRHKAAPRPSVLTAVISDVGYSQPGGGGTGTRASAGAIASGLAAASIGVLVTMMIATGGHSAPRPHLAVPATSVSSSSAVILPLYVPHQVDHTHAAARPRRTPTHHAPEPHAPEPPSGSMISQPENSAPWSFFWIPTSGVGDWRQLAGQADASTWARNMVPPDRHPWP
jgi:hypothetical protein